VQKVLCCRPATQWRIRMRAATNKRRRSPVTAPRDRALPASREGVRKRSFPEVLANQSFNKKMTSLFRDSSDDFVDRISSPGKDEPLSQPKNHEKKTQYITD